MSFGMGVRPGRLHAKTFKLAFDRREPVPGACRTFFLAGLPTSSTRLPERMDSGRSTMTSPSVVAYLSRTLKKIHCFVIARTANKHPLALELFALQDEVELPFRPALFRSLGIHHFVRAVVPDDHIAGAVVPLRDDAFEAAVVHRMVFCQTARRFSAGLKEGPLGMAQERSTPSISSRKS